MDHSSPLDLEFTPASYGDDPVEQVFAVLPDETTRRTAWRLLAKERISDLEILLVRRGVLGPDGAFDLEKHPGLDWESPGKMAGAKTTLADLSSLDYYNTVEVMREGWHWVIQGSFDSVREELGSSTTLLSMRELIAMLDGTGLVGHFRDAGEDVVWESKVYPHLGEYYEAEARTQGSGQEDAEDGDVTPPGESSDHLARDAQQGDITRTGGGELKRPSRIRNEIPPRFSGVTGSAPVPESTVIGFGPQYPRPAPSAPVPKEISPSPAASDDPDNQNDR